MAQGGFDFVDLGSLPELFTVTPGIAPPSVHTTLTLIGTNTGWTGSTVFTVSGVAGTTIFSQSVTDATHATIVIAAGATLGILTIKETVTGSAQNTILIAVALSATVGWRLNRPGGAGIGFRRLVKRPLFK